MSYEKFQEDCPGCRPVMIDFATGVPLPDSHPIMQAILGAWNETTHDERAAFHRFTCLNSRDMTDLTLVHGINAKFKKATEVL